MRQTNKPKIVTPKLTEIWFAVPELIEPAWCIEPELVEPMLREPVVIKQDIASSSPIS